MSPQSRPVSTDSHSAAHLCSTNPGCIRLNFVLRFHWPVLCHWTPGNSLPSAISPSVRQKTHICCCLIHSRRFSDSESSCHFVPHFYFCTIVFCKLFWIFPHWLSFLQCHLKSIDHFPSNYLQIIREFFCRLFA